MKPVNKDERFTLSKIVSDNLKQYILDHELKPGDKLPSERDLVKMMNVSRSILREALRTLESSGILIIRHGDGAFVQSDEDLSVISEQFLFMWKLGNKKQSDLLELRRIYESSAIEEAIFRASKEDLDTLEQLANQMKDLMDTKAIQDADIEFHRGLLKATNNDLFIQMADFIVEYFANVPHRHMDPQERDKSLNEHLQIVQAIREKDILKGKLLLREHLNYSKKHLQFVSEVL